MSRTIKVVLGVVAAIFLVGLVLTIWGWATATPPTARQLARIRVNKAREQRIIRAIDQMALQASQPRPIVCKPPFFDGEGMPILGYSRRGQRIVCWARGVEVDPLTGKLVEEVDEEVLQDREIGPKIFSQYGKEEVEIPDVAPTPCPPTPLAVQEVTPPPTPPAPAPKPQHHGGKVVVGNAECSGDDCGRGPVVYGNADACGSECGFRPGAGPAPQQPPQFH